MKVGHHVFSLVNLPSIKLDTMFSHKVGHHVFLSTTICNEL